MPRNRRLRLVLCAFALTPACTHSVPISFEPEGGAFVDETHPFVVATQDGHELVVGRDWDLVITLRDGSRRVIDEPLRIAHTDGAVTVVERWGERRFPDPDVKSLALERQDTAGTVALVAAGSVLLVGGVWGLSHLLLFALHPDP